jgi:hypothetical protein
MALSLGNYKTVRVQEPVSDVEAAKTGNRTWGILKGPSKVRYEHQPATSWSQTNASFNLNVPDTKTIVDRRIMLKLYLQITLDGTAPVGQNLIQSGFDSLCDHPVAKMTDNLIVNINGVSANVTNQYQYIDALLRYNNEFKDGQFSLAPSAPDMAQRYQSLSNSIRNNLGPYTDSNDEATMGNGGFRVVNVTNSNTQAVYTVEVTEPIFVSPLIFGISGEYPGFLGINKFTLNTTWASGNILSRIWRHNPDSGSVINSVSVVQYAAPEYLCKFITPQLATLPRSVSYQYFRIQSDNKDAAAVLAPNATVRLQSDTIEYGQVPKHMYIFVRRRDTDLDFTQPDAYCGITRLRVRFGNDSQLFDANQEQLYMMSRMNGLDMNFTQFGGRFCEYVGGAAPEFHGGIGSVLKVRLGKDIGLADNIAPSVNGSFQINIEVDAVNLNQVDSYVPSLYVIGVLEGTALIQNGSMALNTGVLSETEVENAHAMDKVDLYNEEKHMSGAGASFLGAIGDFLGKSGRKAMKGLDYLDKTVCPKVEKMNKKLQGKGGILIGGNGMSRSQLRSRLYGEL